MNDKQKKPTHKKVKTKTSVDIIHKMREIVNLAKLLRHFLGLWTVQHLKPRHTVTSQHSPLLGRSVRDPAASLFQAPRWSEPGIEEARRRKNGRKLFSRPALLFASSTLLRAFPTIWGPGTGYPVATWNAAAVTWETTRGGWVCRLQHLLLKHFWKTSHV